MIKAVLFDYFGVVSSDEYWSFVNESNNTPSADSQEFHRLASTVNLGKLTWDEFLTRVARRTNTSTNEVNKMYEMHRLNRKILMLVEQLHAKYKTGMITNANTEYLRPIIRLSGLDHYFDTIVISSEVGAIKPYPEIYKRAARDLGVTTKECVLIDDMRINTEGARDVGMQAIVYESFDQLTRELQQVLMDGS